MDLPVILAFASALFGGALALTVAWYERRSLIHWSFVAGLMVLAAESVFCGLSEDGSSPAEIVYWQNWRLAAMSCLPGIWLVFSLTYARGNPREFLKKWLVVLVPATVVPIALVMLTQGSLIVTARRDGPASAWMLGLGPPGFVLELLFLISAILVVMNLERTYRAAVGTMKWRIKFMVLGLGVLFAARAYTGSQTLLVQAINLPLQAVNTGAFIVACALSLRAVFRVGHFDVKVYPSHAVLHRSLTVLLAGAYLLVVGLLAKIVTYLGGNASFTLKASLILISLVLLAVLLFSEQVGLHTARFVSRHFQRPLHDYRRVWHTLTAATARCVEKGDFCSALSKWLSDTFQALTVTVWVLDQKAENLSFAASTALSAADARRLKLDASDAAQVLPMLARHPEPFDMDSSKEVWAIILRRLHPDEFHKGGNRIGAPLIAGGELLGLVTLGDRVGGVPFSQQDFDLLKSVGLQAAASLLNLQLAQRLSQAKQMEAFQTMSSFFVHDLKNTATTLSLMLQNLPAHFGDPAFREDALRGISGTVTHINNLISRLGLLRQEISVLPVESDLNALVTDTVKCLEAVPRVELVKELRPLPKVRLDPGQIQNVVTNLLLNAKESLNSGGKITIATSQVNGWAVLAVCDTGCGMSADFMERSLFRPFQTTKRKGIGIGMFQCRVIVEAHRGRIEVESEPGKGTTFRVLLPLHSKAAAENGTQALTSH